MINQLLGLPPVIFYSSIALASLIIVAKSADLVVYSISNYAKKLGISDYLIGFLVVSIGTALPELVAALTGALANKGTIAIGTVLGSNLFKLPLLGLILIFAKVIKLKEDVGGNAPIITLLLTCLPIILLIDGTLSQKDGAILIVAFIIYVAKLWQSEGLLGKMKKSIKLKHIWQDGIIFALSLSALLLSARWLVYSSIEVSNILKISPYIIGLLVIGIGASAPELTVQIRSISKNHHGMAFGNVLGSLVANSALVLGIVAIIRPISVKLVTILPTSLFMIAGIMYTLIIMGKEKVNYKHGLVLISIYIIFLVTEFIF